jgi:methionyl aminopeptidase
MTISSPDELAGMQRVGRLVAETIAAMQAAVAPGITTRELDAIAAQFARARGARSAPQLTYGFPGFTCISVNEVIVHGVPGERRLKPGDIVTLDVTLELDGFMADSARTVPVGVPSPIAARLIATAERAWQAGCDVARPGRSLREVGAAVERTARSAGAFVFRDLCGHGIGRALHEPPEVPNWDDPSASTVLHEGLVFALEPMVAVRPARVYEEHDGWTLRTHNRALSAHFEHTLVIQHGEPLLLTAI